MKGLNGKEKVIMGTNIEFSLTRSFIESTNTLLGGKGVDAATMAVNSLGDNEVIANTEKGQKFKIVLGNALKIIGKKIGYNEVVFFNMQKC